MVACSFVVEAIAVTRSSLRRPPVALMLHLAALAVVTTVCGALTGRPLFSAGVALVLIGLLAVIGNAKYASLREPLVFSDLSLFSQVFSHPRLYLPFLGLGKLIIVLAGITAAAAAFIAERSEAPAPRFAEAVVALICLPVCIALSRRVPVTLQPFSDQRRLGFFSAFVAYLVNGLSRAQRRAFDRATAAGPFSAGRPDVHPDVIVIQSESYFDARRLGECVSGAPYAHFDQARRESFEQGELAVPAWGANTMRSEFAMLTGMSSAELGYARFYPYMFVRRACASLAAYFSRGGYRTVAVHPYDASFFGRRRAFAHMHFDRFLDIDDFADASRVGPYVGDLAVADKLIALLRASDDKPMFAFAITMENHGPLHLETVASGESTSRHTLGDDARWRDLTAYLRHVENADAMIGRLTSYLRERSRPTVLCFYGDHVPAMSSVFNALDTEPTHSDYFIWRNFGSDIGTRRDVGVEALGSTLQRAMIDADVAADSRNDLQQMPA
ncbi:LTA synthase family protein [Paraburkholderia sp. ZP32-5]|uniref:LTA synthase family protein n=1 Tax=Paraburkholderia sp. ZP32-5 TaxID=2883245 RepID=UPI001F39A0D0|nr:LTA synthase family protein [Paraburkholderia sp. ZP32-5]